MKTIFVLLVFLLLPGLARPRTSFALRDGEQVLVGNNGDWFSVSAYRVVNRGQLDKKGFLTTGTRTLDWTSNSAKCAS